MEVESKQQILERRKKIEQDIIDLLSRAESDFSLDDVKDVIYTNDAWNYFPHKILKGLSPVEKILEYQNKQRRK